MRRGHPGVGGWRGENQRHFRPRGNGTPSFRTSRPFGLLDSPRFPPPGPSRQYRGPPPFGPHPGRPDNIPQSVHHERSKYRINNLPQSQDRGYHNRGRQMPPYHQLRQSDNEYGEPNFYKNPNQCHINTMGDIDHRRQHQPAPWVRPPFENRQYYDDHRSPVKGPRHFNVGDDLPDYSGHRPPASDHYSSTTGSNSNNSQYTHSVDDTVDIIRKRLQNRDKQQVPDLSIDHLSMTEDSMKTHTENYQEMPQEQPVKKKVQRQKNIKSNCDKIKNKIVHQLFKMDKVKIHKLMDNPSSSTKFEYAISSLITEGQNSLNRHLRSVAEKSLCSSSTDFIQDDTNTIYEDTFMKQMQGVLDPQDTVLLEDMKPLVMAELSRVLQLDDYQFNTMQDHGTQNYERQYYDDLQNHELQDHGIQEHAIQDQGIQEHELQDDGMQEHDIQDQGLEKNDCGMPPKDEPHNYVYFDGAQNSDQYSQEVFFEEDQPVTNNYNNVEITPSDIDGENYRYDQQTRFESKPLFERRQPKKVDHNEERRSAAERRQSRHSVENTFGYIPDPPISDSSRECPQPIPLFDPNAEQLSDDDDTFAEFDKQYHVAVDLNFLENTSRPPSPPISYLSSCDKSPSYSRHNRNIVISTDTPSSTDIKKEIDSQVQNIAKSPVKLLNFASNTLETESKTKIETVIKKEAKLEKENVLAASCEYVEMNSTEHVKREGASKKREIKKEPEKQENAPNTKAVLQSNTRKRSSDQKPSHRKEKRKRSSHSECQDVAKSFLNMFFVNDAGSKETSKVRRANSTEKTYSDKYVKRKEPQKKQKEKDSVTLKTDESKKDSNRSSNHSNLSPKHSLSNEISSKRDHKKKLKPIDMFVEQPKKANSHQTHRNTFTTPVAVGQTPDDSKPKPITPTVVSFKLGRKLSSKNISTQTDVLKVRTRESQTDKLKRTAKQTQTVPVSISISKEVATNPLERMKEIDMEIQLLLQEKFKLYNSLETKTTAVPMDTIPSLSMRVFKVNTEHTEEKSNDSEDAIVDDFTSIPAEELEQIALETISDEKSPVKPNKKNLQHKVLERMRKSSESPTTKRHKKKLTSPNISLIEQIITDDRPIEDIISLDDLETTPAKTKKKYAKKTPKKKSLNSKKLKISKAVVNTELYDIRDCSVVLNRIEVNNYLKAKSEEPPLKKAPECSFEVPAVTPPVDNNSRTESDEHSHLAEDSYEHEEICTETQDTPNMVQVVEEVVNDLQFDMLDVSEDIIIGDNCEVKGDKADEKESVPEEIILDNSQSSMEDAVAETAGAENECKMYDYSTNENLRRDAITVTGNADAVLAIECVENDFIAACLDGNVYHFSASGQLLNTLRGTNQAVTCLTIVQEKYGTTVYTGSLDSRIRYYDLETGMEKGPECNVLSPIQTMDRAWDTVFVGTRTGFVLQFECKNNMLIPVSTVKFSEQSILALRAMKEGPRKVLLVAARSENVVTIKDAQTGLLLRTLQGPKMSVYTLLFEDGKVYCGTSSHNIHVFDYTSGSHVGSHEGGKGAVCLRASGGLLFAGCYDGCVYVYREGEARPLAQLRGPSLMLLSLAIQGTKIIAGYKDRGLYIWKMPPAIVQEMIL